MIVLFVMLAAVGLDSQKLALGGIHVYRRTLAPFAESMGARCRFTPTCSHYAEKVIARDGLVRGGWKSMKRIALCGPWKAMGTRDEP